MKNYWYNHFYKTYSENIKDNNYPTEWLKEEMEELKQLNQEGSAYRHGVLYFYNPEDKYLLEGKMNAISTLLNENKTYYFSNDHFNL